MFVCLLNCITVQYQWNYQCFCCLCHYYIIVSFFMLNIICLLSFFSASHPIHSTIMMIIMVTMIMGMIPHYFLSMECNFISQMHNNYICLDYCLAHDMYHYDHDYFIMADTDFFFGNVVTYSHGWCWSIMLL